MFARVDFFKNLKGQHSLNCKKHRFRGLRKQMWLTHIDGLPAAQN
jgi:hypothetical protein